MKTTSRTYTYTQEQVREAYLWAKKELTLKQATLKIFGAKSVRNPRARLQDIIIYGIEQNWL